MAQCASGNYVSGETPSSVSERRGRWNRADRLQTSHTSCNDSSLADSNEVKESERSQDGRWRGMVKASGIKEKECCHVGVVADANAKTVYTIGTWRVSREVYVEQLLQLGIKTLIDIRGNPKAGREDKLHRGKDLTRALAIDGIQYEYWGDKLGEGQVESESSEDLRRVLKGLMAVIPAGPFCLLGHMHEPHKCHRLALCELLGAGSKIRHLMWKDHQSVYILQHSEAKRKHDTSMDYFQEKLRFEQQRRKQTFDGSELERASVVAIAASATKLPILRWESTTAAEFENRLRDGCAYRLLLPWETEILWYPHFLQHSEADDLEGTVHEQITMYHPTYNFQTPSGIVEEKINRKGQAKICDDFTFAVQYSSRRDTTPLYVTEKLEPWSRSLLHKVEAASETVFNAIWFNHYRDGTVTIHWHTDSDEGLGPNAVIGSLSLGATRNFCLKSKRSWIPPSGGSPGIVHISLPLFHGSLVVMGHNSQTHWLHAVPAMEGVHRERTNLTFRFYAHEDLALGTNSENDSSQIRLQNSKLLRDPSTKGENRDADNSKGIRSMPVRLRLSPNKEAWGNKSYQMHSILIDAPSDPNTTVEQICNLLCEQLLPPGIGQVKLAIPGINTVSFDVLEPSCILMSEFARRCICDEVAELILLPTNRCAEKCVYQPEKTLALAWPGMLTVDASSASADFRYELQSAPPGEYLPFHNRRTEISTEGDWIREILQNLSGIQRKSKGRGQVSHFVFHQCSEFIAVYAGRPKSSVHLIISPKRLLKREDFANTEAPMVSRMSFYASHLACSLGQLFPATLFAVGLRMRPGRTKQFHAHLISMDLVAPRFEFLLRRHFEDFTCGVAHFFPLDDLACRLAVGYGLPAEPSSGTPAKELSCHRCGHLFADAMMGLSKHLACCQSWPLTVPKNPADSLLKVPSVAVGQDAKLRTLEDMGFGSCGREALEAALLKAGGSVEGAVAQLVA